MAPKGERVLGMVDDGTTTQDTTLAPHIQMIKSSSRFSKIFLTAMVHELYTTGMGEITFEKLADRVSCFCTSNGEQFPGYDSLLKIGCRLGESRIIICESGAKHRFQRLQLNFPSDDYVAALRDCEEIPWLSKYLLQG